MSNLFEIDIMDEETVPSVPADGVHRFVLTGHAISEAPWDGNNYLTLFYKLNEQGNPFNGTKINKKFQLTGLDELDGDKALKLINNYKAWMRGHGVPEDQLANPDFDSLHNVAVDIYGRGYDGAKGRMWGMNNAKLSAE